MSTRPYLVTLQDVQFRPGGARWTVEALVAADGNRVAWIRVIAMSSGIVPKHRYIAAHKKSRPARERLDAMVQELAADQLEDALRCRYVADPAFVERFA